MELNSQPPPLVWVVMGSDSDLPVMAAALQTLEQFEVPYAVSIASAHRCTDYVLDLAKAASSRGVRVIIAGAGLAAHLPGVIAAATTLPVIGVPLASGPLVGQDALYAIVQMPPGIPVATVGIAAAQNAALLAVRILGSSDAEVAVKLQQYAAQLQAGVLAKNHKLQELGYKKYLEGMPSK
ncbi:MAG: 5-(carboxyamino)imidazole ribonucleotide mutase [Symbiobacteriaceae bacterium]|nr:5-(carboxyamino)imidazole ribonucleotide mutase [Symbiobacteriaceae bacterium]